MTAAILSSPDRIRLTTEEITDMFDFLGIRNLMVEPDDLVHLYATSVAYAGFGLGLCQLYTDPYACAREVQYFPTQRLLHLDFAPASLSGTIMSLRGVRDGSVDETFIDIDLGLGRLESYPEGESAYWAAVRDRIRSLVQSFRPRITQLILTGFAVGDERFKEVVRQALRDLISASALDGVCVDIRDLDGDSSEETARDVIYLTARGAAEFAKPRQEGRMRCAEREECKRIRIGIDQDDPLAPGRFLQVRTSEVG